MKIDLIVQPDSQMGVQLIDLLRSQTPSFSSIWIISAFANRQGVRYLAPHIIQAKSHGANIKIVVGIDHQSTSAEALQELIALDVDARVVHNTRPGHTFHPKIYLFEATGAKVELIVGSNNLTVGGLFTNYEASTRLTLDLPEDDVAYSAIKQSLERYLNPMGKTVQSLTDDVIKILIEREDVPTEKQAKEARRHVAKSGKKISADIPKSPFSSERLKSPPTLPKLLRASATKKSIRKRKNAAPFANRGQMIWAKYKLPATDVQRQPGNVTGGIRLTQAGWEINGKAIDQTTYFRNGVFGKLKWKDWKAKPKLSEITRALFDIQILGTSYGLHELSISHKPSGEAGQGNYTTMLHWDDLGGIIRDLNLVGKTLRLYAPPNARAEPFFIEII